MGRQIKCVYCGEVIDNDTPSKKYGGKNYHTNCYNQMCEEKYQQSTDKNRDNAQAKLYDYICQLFNISELTPFLDFQLRKMFKENKFTYNGVLYSLKYFYELKDNKPDITYGIGIVPLIYDEAKNFYHKKSILKTKNNIEINNLPTIKVKVDPKSLQKKTKKPYVNIENLWERGDNNVWQVYSINYTGKSFEKS